MLDVKKMQDSTSLHVERNIRVIVRREGENQNLESKSELHSIHLKELGYLKL